MTTTTIDNELLDRHAREIGPAAVALYLLLRRLATEREGSLIVAGYSHEELAERLGSSRRSIIRILDSLKRYGLLHFPSTRGRRIEYILITPAK